MRKLFFLFFFLLSSCSPRALPIPESYSFYELRLQDNTLISENKEYKIKFQEECGIDSLYPAPRSRVVAIEIQCPRGFVVGIWEPSSAELNLLLPNDARDSHFLAWDQSTLSLYLQTDVTSNPQIYRVNLRNGQFQKINLPYVYHMDVSSTGDILSASTRGIGFGSELSVNGNVILKDEKNIMTFAKFSPSAKQIAFITLPDTQTPFPLGALWVVDADGTNARMLAPADAGRGFEAAWHPNGESIAFVYRENSNDAAADQSFNNLESNIYLVNASTGALTQFTNLPNSFVDAPRFSPDGQFIVFNVWSDKIQLWRVDVKTKTLELPQNDLCCGFWLSNE